MYFQAYHNFLSYSIWLWNVWTESWHIHTLYSGYVSLHCGLFFCCSIDVSVCGKRDLYFIFSCHCWQHETLVLWVIVCFFFMRMFGICEINVLLSLTHFSLVWYFVSLVFWLLSYINTVCALTSALDNIKCSVLLKSCFPLHLFLSHPHTVCVWLCVCVLIHVDIWSCQWLSEWKCV